MKEIFSTAIILFSVICSAQITLSGKANVLFNTDNATWTGIKNSATQIYQNNGKNSAGFNVGLSAKIDLPTSLFVMPEIYYTTFKNEYTESVTNTTIEAKSNRVDVPVLLGYNVLGKTIGIFAGPVASYNLSTDNQYNDFKENATKQFTVGYQFGAQVQIKKIIFNGRYEGAFSQNQREFISNNTNTTIRFDSRPSLLMFGIGYQF